MPSRVQSLLDELKRRRVVRSVLAYAAAAFALLQAAQLVFDGLLLPDLAFRVLVILALAGFPAVIVLAWVYELTAEGLRKTGPAPDTTRKQQRVPLRRWLQVGVVFIMAAIVAAFTAVGLGRLRFPAAGPDGRVGLAVFPFRVSGSADAAWSEGAADLLATALDGTVGLRIVDPWSLWRPLRHERDAPAQPPDPEQATALVERVGAHRFLLASVVPGGDRIDLNVRLYQLGRVDPIATFAVTGDAGAMAELVRDAAVGVLVRVWGTGRPPSIPAELDFHATRSPDALKAYLAAKDALRRGNLDSANAAIDQSIALDSTFVLALVDGVTIKSWSSLARGQPYTGFFALLDRAEAFADSLNPRTRLRLESMRASVETDGARADAAARRILEIDPHDLAANASLAYYEMVYGWQYGRAPFSGREQAERVVQLDSTSLTALASRAYWAVAMADTADQRAQLARIARVDTTAGLGRRWLIALRANLAGDSTFAAMLPALASAPAADRIAIIRVLRANQAHRAAAYLDVLRQSPDPRARALGSAELANLDIARGRSASVDSAITSGAFRANNTFRTLQALIVAASLVEIGEDAVTRRTVAALGEYVKPDSALAHFGTRPVWWFGWLIGAYHATAGDSAVAQRWMDAIGTLPPGGAPLDYRGALQADIRARLAARAGDLARAMEEARTAYTLWSIHTENQLPAAAEPAMRFHLGMLHLQAGRPDSAYALFTSLVPPTTWMGFLTARASFEMGGIASARGENGLAAFHYTRALRLWEDAGAGATQWVERARARLASIVRG